MKIPNPFRSGRQQPSSRMFRWHATQESLSFMPNVGLATENSISAVLASNEVGSLLEQLSSEELAETRDDAFFISWEQVHELTRSRVYASSIALLELPHQLELVPRLQSRGSLTDAHFAIGISGWTDSSGAPRYVMAIEGSMVRVDGSIGLLPLSTWRLLDAIAGFGSRALAERTPQATRRQWGIIRRLAIEADAILDDFLIRSIVVTPEKLDIEFRRTTVGSTTIVEIVPGFDGAPTRWLEFFDSALSVPEHLNIPTADGAVHVALTEPVRAVLREIKRLPGRRAAGQRAEAFLLNPVAALGDAAAEILDPAQFASARERAGIIFERFRPVIVRDAVGYPGVVGVEVHGPNGEVSQRNFENDSELETFIVGLGSRIHQGLQLFCWQGFDFELDGETPEHLAAFTAALEERRKPGIVVHHDRIFDLSSYYDRITGIGHALPFISAYIVKKSDEEGWFQSNLLALLKFQPAGASAPITVPLTPESLPAVDKAIQAATASGQNEVTLAGCSVALPLVEVEAAVRAFRAALVSPSPTASQPRTEDGKVKPVKPTLLIKGNIDALDHLETREERLAFVDTPMRSPTALKSDAKLRQHQIEGVARLQHLFQASPTHCRGVLLADDMGLGKTLQILTFIAMAFEDDAELAPALIVAPVSLLENWQEEIMQFFHTNSLRTLVAYGEALAKHRVPRESVDAALQNEGLVRFLKSNWRGDAQIVLTTYETLRDLEFSFAQESWSILVCDEAQKIKNPNAMVTRATKKLNVRFRVACTGTPVENSLVDLWCLFDMVQPGLLGALNEFGRDFGRIIETETDAAPEKREALRRLIDPQLIRRTKADVAKDLPRKFEAPNCLISMSNEQRVLYVGALQQFHEPAIEEAGAQYHHLGLLQYLRLICADPRRYGMETFVPEELATYLPKAPKMAWLLRTLRDIRQKDEKALVFVEHRDVQRLLQHYIAAEFGFTPRIVNGDTAVSAKSERSRQKVIKEFQQSAGFGVIILSPLAVGFGVNIQAANHVIHYLRHWNPAKEDQATDRAYRIGQTRDVHVYCPLTVATDFKTFDVKLDELLRRKRGLAGDMLRTSGAISGAEFDLREILPASKATLRNDPITLERIERSDPHFFEAIVAALWQKQGYECQLTQQSDAGVDVVGRRGLEGVLIQCKASSVDGRQHGWEAVKEVVGGTAIYSEKFPMVQFRRIGLTNQGFNVRARDRARANGVELIENAELGKLISRHPIGTLDVIAMLAAPRI